MRRKIHQYKFTIQEYYRKLLRIFSYELPRYLLIYLLAIIASFFYADHKLVICWILLNFLIVGIWKYDHIKKLPIFNKMDRPTEKIGHITKSFLNDNLRRTTPKETSIRLRPVEKPKETQYFPNYKVDAEPIVRRVQKSSVEKSYSPYLEKPIVREITHEVRENRMLQNEVVKHYQKVLQQREKEEKKVTLATIGSPKKTPLLDSSVPSMKLDARDWTLDKGTEMKELPKTPTLNLGDGQKPLETTATQGTFGSTGSIFGSMKPPTTTTTTTPTTGTTSGGMFGQTGASKQTTSGPSGVSGGIFGGPSAPKTTLNLQPEATKPVTQPVIQPQPQPQTQTSTQPTQLNFPMQASGQGSGDPRRDLEAYRKYFKTNWKIVDEVTNLINAEMEKDQVTKIDRIESIRSVLDAVRPALNAQFGNQINSLIQSADNVITALRTNQNNKLAFYGILLYTVESCLKNSELLFGKDSRLSVYYRAALILIVNKEIPGFAEFVILRIAKEFPILAGIWPERKPGMRDEELYKARGFKYNNGNRESFKTFFNRLDSLSFLFFLLLTVDLTDILRDTDPNEINPDLNQLIQRIFVPTGSFEWIYWAFIKHFLAAPIDLITPNILVSFYRSSAYTLRRNRDPVIKLFKIISRVMVPKLEQYGASIQDKDEKNEFVENKLRVVRTSLQKFNENNVQNMVILNPVEEDLQKQSASNAQDDA